MSHEFETGFVVRDAAWHGLATILQDAPTVEDGIKEAGLDWEVKPCPIEVVTGKTKAQRVLAKGYKAMIRVTDGSVLGILTDRYKPLQNKDAFGFFDKFLKDGSCQLESAGSLKDGKFVWVLAKISALTAEISDGDQVISYLLLSNAHDGSRAITIAFTPIRVVCWNTLSSAHGIADKNADKITGKAIRVLHTENAKANLKAVQEEIDIAERRIGSVVQTAQALRKVNVDATAFYKFMEQVYAPEREAMREEQTELLNERKDPETSEERKDEILAKLQVIEEKLARPLRKTSTLNTLVELFEHGPGAEFAGHTAWGAISAITHFEEHLRPGSNETKVHSSWFGGNTNRIRNRAYDTALSMVS
jgi:phage/plasmid-like protein (TIGR03299 family)